MNQQPKHTSTPVYKTYMFKDKDPVIDLFHTAMDDEGMKMTEVSELSGVSYTTIRNWIDGPTRRPSYACVAAAMAALGREMTWQKKRTGNVVQLKRDRLKRAR